MGGKDLERLAMMTKSLEGEEWGEGVCNFDYGTHYTQVNPGASDTVCITATVS